MPEDIDNLYTIVAFYIAFAIIKEHIKGVRETTSEKMVLFPITMYRFENAIFSYL